MSAKLTRDWDTPRSDIRFVAEATLETGVVLRAESKWTPSHWEKAHLRAEAESELRRKFKQAELMKVDIGSIRIYEETRRVVRYTDTHTSRRLYAEVKK